MNNFHYHQDPLYSAAASILEGTAEVQAIVADFAVGDSTNFGKVLEIGADSITFKAKDLPKTKISFKQRKMGSSEFLLTKLIKLKEETEASEEELDEAYKPLRKPEDLVAELQSIVDAPNSKLWDTTSVSIRLSHEDIFDRFPKIYDYVEDMWYAIMTPDGARKTKEIAKKAIEAVHKHYPIKEEAEETLDEAINWLGDYLTTSEKSQFGGYRPTIIDKKTKRLMYQGAAKYNTPDEAKDHAEDYLKQKSKGIRDPKVPIVGTYKEETEEVTEAVDPATKRRKQLDMTRVNAGAMSQDDYNKKYKLGKYRPVGSKLSGPGGLYKNLVKEVLNPDDEAGVWIDDFVKSDDPRFEGKSKEERIKMALGAWYAAQKKESVESLEEVVSLPSVKKVIDIVDEMSPKEYSNFLHALADNAFGIAMSTKRIKPNGPSNSDAWEDVADGIRDAAKAYDARPVKMSESAEEETQTLEEGLYPLTKKALDATFNLDPDEFEEFLKELAKNLNNEGDDTGYDEWYQVADHIEKAHMIWKKRDSNI